MVKYWIEGNIRRMGYSVGRKLLFCYTACICECYLLAILALHCHNFYILSALHCHYLYILSALHCLYFHVLSELHCHYLYILSALHYHYLYILSALLCHNVQTREPASIRDESQLGVRMSVLDWQHQDGKVRRLPTCS